MAGVIQNPFQALIQTPTGFSAVAIKLNALKSDGSQAQCSLASGAGCNPDQVRVTMSVDATGPRDDSSISQDWCCR